MNNMFTQFALSMASKDRAQAAAKGACIAALRERSTKSGETHLVFFELSSLPTIAGELIQKEYVERREEEGGGRRRREERGRRTEERGRRRSPSRRERCLDRRPKRGPPSRGRPTLYFLSSARCPLSPGS
jgi:hypothetical protein